MFKKNISFVIRSCLPWNCGFSLDTQVFFFLTNSSLRIIKGVRFQSSLKKKVGVFQVINSCESPVACPKFKVSAARCSYWALLVHSHRTNVQLVTTKDSPTHRVLTSEPQSLRAGVCVLSGPLCCVYRLITLLSGMQRDLTKVQNMRTIRQNDSLHVCWKTRL